MSPFPGWPTCRVSSLRPSSTPLDTPRRTPMAASKLQHAGPYGKGYPRTPLSFMRARHAQPLYALRAGHPPNGPPAGRVACGCLLPPWIPLSVRPWQHAIACSVESRMRPRMGGASNARCKKEVLSSLESLSFDILSCIPSYSAPVCLTASRRLFHGVLRVHDPQIMVKYI
jgi:hypothetical protein